MDLTLGIAVLGIVLSCATFFVGRMSAAKSSGAESGTILTEIGYLKKGIDDIQKHMSEQDEHYNALAERVTRCEASVSSAHKRLDDHGVGKEKSNGN